MCGRCIFDVVGPEQIGVIRQMGELRRRSILGVEVETTKARRRCRPGSVNAAGRRRLGEKVEAGGEGARIGTKVGEEIARAVALHLNCVRSTTATGGADPELQTVGGAMGLRVRETGAGMTIWARKDSICSGRPAGRA